MNKNTTWVVILLIIVALIAIFALAKPKATTNVNVEGTAGTSSTQPAEAPSNANEGMNMPTTSMPTSNTAASSTDVSVGVNTGTTVAPSFTVHGGSFYFKPNMLTVKQGDKVSITLVNDGGMHDLTVDGYNVTTQRLTTVGQTDTITFTADKKGTFEFYCTVGQHRQMGMKGTLVVQ